MSTTRALDAPESRAHAPRRCMARGQRLVQVKFMVLPMPASVPTSPAPGPITRFLHRILGLLAAARR